MINHHSIKNTGKNLWNVLQFSSFHNLLTISDRELLGCVWRNWTAVSWRGLYNWHLVHIPIFCKWLSSMVIKTTATKGAGATVWAIAVSITVLLHIPGKTLLFLHSWHCSHVGEQTVEHTMPEKLLARNVLPSIPKSTWDCSICECNEED